MSLSSPLAFSSGLRLQNRLCKAAMVEDLAEAGAKPGTDLNKVYHQWSHGNWGLILTGNVMVDSNQLGSTHNVLAVPGTTDTSNVASDRDKNLLLWKAWAESIQVRNTPALMQLNHPGRRALRYSRKGPALAPSAMSLNLGRGFFAQFLSWLAFGAPRAMTKADIEDTVRRFAAAAKFACDAGFKGVEIHAAHGYLLAQFLSTETNRRTDEYGGTAFNRARLLREVVQNIRQVVPRSFSVGIKLNTVDCQAEESLHDTLEQIGSLIDIGGVDFLDISGGTYEHPQISRPEPSAAKKGANGVTVSSQSAAREAFSIDFAREVRAKYPDIPLMLTGGFRTREGMKAALESGACDLIGLGRPAVVTPDLPEKIILNEKIPDEDAKLPMKAVKSWWLSDFLLWFGIRIISGANVTAAYQKEIRRMIART